MNRDQPKPSLLIARAAWLALALSMLWPAVASNEGPLTLLGIGAVSLWAGYAAIGTLLRHLLEP